MNCVNGALLRNVLLAVVSAVGPVDAQIVRGRIVLDDGTAPLPGVVVTAIGATGNSVANSLSSASGEYLLRVPAPGRYTLRVLRIGFRPTLIDGIEVGRDSVRVAPLVLTPIPVAIAGVSIRDNTDCSVERADADAFVRLWEQARAALIAAQLSGQAARLDVQLIRVDGRVDAMRYHAPDVVGSPVPEIDSSTVREWFADHAFATTPAETLDATGYVRPRADGSLVYDAPGPESLLSDAFLQRHCFGVVKPPRDHPDWIGIAFTPRGKNGSFVDVSGVLWLDRQSAELRHLEFEYTNLPRMTRELCERAAPREALDGSRCQQFTEDGSNRFGVGGESEFRRLPTGEWLTARWILRTLSDEMTYRPGPRATRLLYPKESCTGPIKTNPKPGDCVRVNWPVPRLGVSSTVVARVIRDGSELFRGDTALAFMAAAARTQAGARPSTLEGRISDAAGNPLENVIVQTGKPNRVGITDSRGAFRITALPPVRVALSIRCRGYQPVALTVAMLPDSTRRLSIGLVSDSAEASANCSARR
jgi:hypothetical protein